MAGSGSVKVIPSAEIVEISSEIWFVACHIGNKTRISRPITFRQ